jgi:triosephosphate isomerase
VRLGAQDCCEHGNGAYTGEISTEMLSDLDVGTVLAGHSERRHVFGETDERVHAKLQCALQGGLEVVLCVGETIAEREAGRTEEVVRRQLTSGLEGVAPGDLPRVTLAYEPVWAIGTGHVASPEQAQEVHAYLRGLLAGLYSESASESARILYGGSVKADNAAGLLSKPDIDGALVGGAALSAESFTAIIDSGS